MRRIGHVLALIGVVIAAPLQAQDSGSAADHVPPPPPAQPMADMTAGEMGRVMDMHDDPLLAMFMLDQFEHGLGGNAATTWDAEAWIGHDFNKLWLRSEGEREGGATDARIEAFWDHAFASYWDWQLGMRHDAGSGPARDWAAFGVQGIAPYWFELEATAYVGQSGRTALRLRGEYELLLTQRLILQPEVEANIYGRNDVLHDVAAGLSDASVGLRLRYEIRREFAPYLGVVWTHRNSDGALHGSDTQFVAGVRVWY